MKFNDLWKINKSESIPQRCFHWSRTKVGGSKTIRYRRSLNHKQYRLEIGCFSKNIIFDCLFVFQFLLLNEWKTKRYFWMNEWFILKKHTFFENELFLKEFKIIFKNFELISNFWIFILKKVNSSIFIIMKMNKLKWKKRN